VKRLLLAAALAFAAAAPQPAQAQDLGALDATVRPVNKASDVRSYPVTTPDGRTGTTNWRVVSETGNCCENYLTITQAGRIVDFGGDYPTFSDDRGETWSEAAPLAPYLGGEGAVVNAPNGDILGVGWDPYTGDRLQSFKFEKATGKWRYKDIALHQPFYDREWIGVVPGPVRLPTGQTVPYLTFIRGAYPNKDLFLMSTDGLTYVQTQGPTTGVTRSPRPSLPVVTDPSFDWIQPNTESTFTPLGEGRFVAGPAFLKSGYHLFDPATFTWSTYDPESGGPEGVIQTDGAGRLHDVDPGDGKFVYRVSGDGGATWESTTVALGQNVTIENIDFRTLSSIGIAAVALHLHDEKTTKDFDLLYKFDISGAVPRVTRRHAVGLADVNGGSGVTGSLRFDFETVALLPDGRAVVSFRDSTTKTGPAIAIERDTDLPSEPDAAPVPGGVGGTGDPGSPIAPRPEPTPAPSSSGADGATSAAPPPAPVQAAPAKLAISLRSRRRGKRVELRGALVPAVGGVTVLIERRAGSRWVTVARVRTRASGAFKTLRTLPRGTRLRAVVRGSAERAGAASRIVRLPR